MHELDDEMEVEINIKIVKITHWTGVQLDRASLNRLLCDGGA